jgi:hypothetical protein
MPLIFLVLMYMLHTTGEIFLSPVGLSQITKLSPPVDRGVHDGGLVHGLVAMANLSAASSRADGDRDGRRPGARPGRGLGSPRCTPSTSSAWSRSRSACCS